MKDTSSREGSQMVTARCLFSTLTILSYLLSQDGFLGDPVWTRAFGKDVSMPAWGLTAGALPTLPTVVCGY